MDMMEVNDVLSDEELHKVAGGVNAIQTIGSDYIYDPPATWVPFPM